MCYTDRDWLPPRNAEEKSNPRLFSSKTNARIRNNVSAFFSQSPPCFEELKRVSLQALLVTRRTSPVCMRNGDAYEMQLHVRGRSGSATGYL